MFARTVIRNVTKDEAEKPFWISYADLMTASMIVFLIVAAVTVVIMKTQLDLLGDAGRKVHERQVEIERFSNMVKDKSREMTPPPRVSTIRDTVRVDLGSAVNFVSGSSDISPAGKEFLREYIPKLLAVANTELGQKWLKRIVVEGFTDTDGSYLFNLDLSLQRSRKVVCALFEQREEAPEATDHTMTKEELSQIRDLFLVGGYSFNSMQSSKAKSRRVELKLEFWQLDEKEQFDREPKPDLSDKEFGKC